MGGEFFEDEAIGFEHIVFFAGVDPPAAMNIGEDGFLAIDEGLDGIGDFEFAPPRRFDGVDGIPDSFVEHVDAHQGKVGFGLFGFFDEAQNTAIGVEFGDAV